MRALGLAILGLAAACSIPDKYYTGDGGSPDASTDGGDDGGGDTTPPETTIDAVPPAITNLVNFAITFSSNEAGTFRCSVDGGAEADCLTPFDFDGGDGEHTFSVRAVDLAGNADPTPATHAWTIDTVPPTIAFTAPSPPQNGTSGPYVRLGWTLSEAAAETCSLDGASPSGCTSGVTFSAGHGPHSYRVFAVDLAGNQGNAALDWTVDCTRPLPGAVALFHFDEMGGQALNNAVNAGSPAYLGFNNQPESNEPTRTAGGRFGSGLSYSSTTAQVATWDNGGPIVFSPAATLEVWLRPTPTTSSPQEIMATGDGRIVIFQAPNPGDVRLEVQFMNEAGSAIYLSAPSITANAWHQVIASYDGNTARFYIDGSLVASQAFASTANINITPLHFGTAGANNILSAVLDEGNVSTQAVSDIDVFERWCPN